MSAARHIRGLDENIWNVFAPASRARFTAVRFPPAVPTCTPMRRAGVFALGPSLPAFVIATIPSSLPQIRYSAGACMYHRHAPEIHPKPSGKPVNPATERTNNARAADLQEPHPLRSHLALLYRSDAAGRHLLFHLRD